MGEGTDILNYVLIHKEQAKKKNLEYGDSGAIVPLKLGIEL
jgi:hypothetical protein